MECSEGDVCGAWKVWKFEEKLQRRKKSRDRRREENERKEVEVEREVYCVCREPYESGEFMIECSQCEEWFHGKCVGLRRNEKDWSTVKYHCDFCRDEWGIMEE